MKKIILSTIAFIGFAVVCNVLLTSCGGGGEDEDEGNKFPRTYSMNLTVEASGYSEIIGLSDLQTNIVSAVSSENWVLLARQPYTSGSPTISVYVHENISFESRTCEVTITASDENKVIIHITQKEKTMPEKKNEYTDQSALTKRLN